MNKLIGVEGKLNQIQKPKQL